MGGRQRKRACIIFCIMQRRRFSLNLYIAPNRGAGKGAPRGRVSLKILVNASALLLSVCAAVFTFIALTKAEAWLATRRAGGGTAVAAPAASQPSAAAPAYYREGGEPSFSAAPPSFSTTAPPDEITAPETNAEDEGEDEDNMLMRQRLMEDMAVMPPTLSARRQQRGRIPPPQPSIPTSPKTKSGVPFMITNAATDINLFALTFDGGSQANAAADILDTLASRGVKSTVFLTGAFIKRYPQIVMRIAAEGHELGNHTMNHPRLTTYAENRTQTTRPEVSQSSIANELAAAERLLFERAEGLRFAPLWRAPFGEYNREICEWALAAGYIHICWRQGGSWRVNLDSNDWVANENSPAYKTPQEVFDKITAIASTPGGLNGGIILMHLGTERRQRSQQVHTILGKLIDTLRNMGYKPVTVSTLLYHSGVDIDLARVD
jgi:peptidoglycan/xylan/chitin deacetylase (PgdA/CDA1 family)